MIIKISRKNGKIDCIEICPEDLEEEGLLNGIINDEVNLKSGMFLLYKEDKLKGKKVRKGMQFTDNIGTKYEEYHHS